MNYQWGSVFEDKSPSENTILAFDAEIEEGKVRAVIYITPKIIDFENKRVLFSRVYFRTKKCISDFSFHAVSDDLFELCERKFSKGEIYETAFNEYSTVSRIPSIKPFTFGDYSKSE